jgi:hypothetical protein
LTAGAVAVATTIALAGLVAWPAGAAGRPLLLAVGMLAALLQAAAVVRAAIPLATASAVVLLADYAVAAVISQGPKALSRSPSARVSSWRPSWPHGRSTWQGPEQSRPTWSGAGWERSPRWSWDRRRPRTPSWSLPPNSGTARVS